MVRFRGSGLLSGGSEPRIMMSIRFRVLVAVMCAAVFSGADAAEGVRKYSVELVVERLDGSALQGKAECSREAWCEVRLAGSFRAEILHFRGEYKVSIYGSSGSPVLSKHDCCGIESSQQETITIPGDRRSASGDLYYGPHRSDLVFRKPQRFGIFSIVFNDK
jgi:hypothetical protein